MKKILVLLFFFMAVLGRAQSGISYQAVIMSSVAGQLPGADNPKSPLVDASICLRLAITSPAGIDYEEQITTTTDSFGMVNVVFGDGSRPKTGGTAANLAAISWGSGPKSLKVELDETGSCANFTLVSNQPFTGVPFAYYAASLGSGGGSTTSYSAGTGVTLTGTTFSIGQDVAPSASPTFNMLNAGNSTLASAIITTNATVGGNLNAGSIQNTPIGSTSASTGAFTTLASSNNATIEGALSVTGATNLNNNLNVVGTTTAAAINATNINASGTLGVTGNSTLGGTLNAGATTLASAVVTGNTSIGGTTTVADINASGNLGVTGNSTLGGTLNAGATTLASAIVTGNTTIGGTTTVADINASGNLGVTGNSTLGGTLNAGATTLASAVVTNDITVGGKVNVKEIVDSSSGRIETSGANPTFIHAMSGRFSVNSGTNTITVKNNYVTTNSIILCSFTKNPSGSAIVSVVASNHEFTIFHSNSFSTVDINFLVIN